jgi:hypothetical protein
MIDHYSDKHFQCIQSFRCKENAKAPLNLSTHMPTTKDLMIVKPLLTAHPFVFRNKWLIFTLSSSLLVLTFRLPYRYAHNGRLPDGRRDTHCVDRECDAPSALRTLGRVHGGCLLVAEGRHKSRATSSSLTMLDI